MELRKIVCRFALLALTCASALAQEDPEAVYAKLHSAMLAGNAGEVAGYSTAATRAELAAKPQAERDALIRGMAQAAPKTYTITEKSIAADGNSAVLRGTGISEFQGRAESYLNAVLKKEGDAWKVVTWGWSNQKPPPAAKPVAATAPAVEAVAATQQVVITRKAVRLPAAAAAQVGPEVASAKPEVAPAPVAAAQRPSRAHLDARECLKLPTDKAIMACAEKFR